MLSATRASLTTLFSPQPNITNFSTHLHHLASGHANFRPFLAFYAFSTGFPGEKPLKHRADVTQHVFAVRIHSIFAWRAAMGMPTWWKILMSFCAWQQIHHVQPGQFGSADRTSLEARFFHLHQTYPNCFHTMASPWPTCMPSFVHLCHCMYFLWFFQ